MNRRLVTRLATYVGLVVVAGVLPYAVLTSAGRLLAVTILIFALLAVSWNLTIGYGGIFNFAHVGFFGLGGYATAISTANWNWNPWLGLAFGCAVGAVAGGVAFIPVIRMRGIYVALITFIFVQLCSYLVLATPKLTGGSAGITGIPSLTLGSFDFSEFNGLGYLWFLGFAVAGFLILLDSVVRSSFGRSLIALRDNEQLALSRGVNRVRQQILAFIVSGALAGIAGGLYVSYFGVADATLFSFGFVTLGLSMIFLGGLGYVWGPLLGAIIVTAINQQLNSLAAWGTIIIGVGTVVVIVFLPRGLAGAFHDVWSMVARRFRRRSPS